MSTLITAFLAALPRALLALMAKLLTDKFAAAVVEAVVVHGIKLLVTNTKTTLDDDAAKAIFVQLGRNADGSAKD